MGAFFLSKNIAKVGDIVNVYNTCTGGTANFGTSDSSIANIYYATGAIIANNIGETNVIETTSYCSNTGGILLTVTEDGNAPIMSVSDYKYLSQMEMVVVIIILLMVFFINFGRR